MAGLLGQVRQATGELLGELNLGGGFGISYLPEDDPVSFFQRADDALYRAKEAGKGRVVAATAPRLGPA